MDNEFTHIIVTLRPFGLDQSIQQTGTAYRDRNGMIHGRSQCDTNMRATTEVQLTLWEFAASRFCPDSWCTGIIMYHWTWAGLLLDMANAISELEPVPEHDWPHFQRQQETIDRLRNTSYGIVPQHLVSRFRRYVDDCRSRNFNYLTSIAGKQFVARMYYEQWAATLTQGTANQFSDLAAHPADVIFGARTSNIKPLERIPHPVRMLVESFTAGQSDQRRSLVLASSERFCDLVQPTLPGILTRGIRLTPQEDLAALANLVAALWDPFGNDTLDAFPTAVQAARAILA